MKSNLSSSKSFLDSHVALVVFIVALAIVASMYLTYKKEGYETVTGMATACTDSDGGKIYDVQGTCTPVYGSPVTDSCLGTTYLIESYCSGSSCMSEYHPCNCNNGACVSVSCDSSHCSTCTTSAACTTAGCNWCSTTSSCVGASQGCTGQCSDTDNGLDYFTAGTCTSPYNSFSDSCSGNTLHESYCLAYGTMYICSQQTKDCTSYTNEVCSAGACACTSGTCPIGGNIANGCSAAACITCSDTDNGIFPFTSGTCTDSANPNGISDSCNGGAVTEYYCENNLCKSTTFSAGANVVCADSTKADCSSGTCIVDQHDSSMGCSAAACGQCTDSDNGIFPYTPGVCTDSANPSGISDRCVSGGLVEYYCRNSACAYIGFPNGPDSSCDIATHKMVCSWGTCPNDVTNASKGCSNSACTHCTDTDNGIFPFTAGTCTDDGRVATDGCYGSGFVEFYCQNNACIPVGFINGTDTSCAGDKMVCSSGTCPIAVNNASLGCSASACGTCVDSDNGVFPFTAGICTDYMHTGGVSDYCLGTSIIEYTCKNNVCQEVGFILGTNMTCQTNKDVCSSGTCPNDITNASLGCSVAACGTVAISLTDPKFGVSPSSTFDVKIKTDRNAECRYSLTSGTSFASMTPFTTTGETTHTKTGHTLSDSAIHPFYVNCRALDTGIIASAQFDLSADTTPPNIGNANANPNYVSEPPFSTTLNVETDEKSFCKYSSIKTSYSAMENTFAADNNESSISNYKLSNQKTISGLPDHAIYQYNVVCKNLAGLESSLKIIQFEVNSYPKIIVISPTQNYMSSNTTLRFIIETTKSAICSYGPTEAAGIKTGYFGWNLTTHTSSILTFLDGHYTYFFSCILPTGGQPFTESVTFTIDTTPPSTPLVNDTDPSSNDTSTTRFIDRLFGQWYSADNASGIKEYSYSVWNRNSPDAIINWRRTASSRVELRDLDLNNGATYYFKVYARNNVGLVSEIGESDGVTVKYVPPPIPAICNNSLKNTGETDIDCGGICPPCQNNRLCLVNSDCSSNFCRSPGICTTPTCSDGIKNGGESDVDCGGTCGVKCAVGDKCLKDGDCTSNTCTNGECASSQSTVKDIDGDGIPDSQDNCPLIPNKDQADMDKDGLGNVCDDDIDNDGIPNTWETDHGLNPNDPSDANEIYPGTLMTYKQKYQQELSGLPGNNETGKPPITAEPRGILAVWWPVLLVIIIAVPLLFLMFKLIGFGKKGPSPKLPGAPSKVKEDTVPEPNISPGTYNPEKRKELERIMEMRKQRLQTERKEMFREFEQSQPPSRPAIRVMYPIRKPEEPHEAAAMESLSKLAGSGKSSQHEDAIASLSNILRTKQTKKRLGVMKALASKNYTKIQIINSVKELSADKRVSHLTAKKLLVSLLKSKRFSKNDVNEIVTTLANDGAIYKHEVNNIIDEVVQK